MNMTLSQWRARISHFFGAAKPKAVPRPTGRLAECYSFVIPISGRIKEYRITALTRSEARAILKRQLGLDRLPVGASLRAKPAKQAA